VWRRESEGRVALDMHLDPAMGMWLRKASWRW
jgi:hypothetical protein